MQIDFIKLKAFLNKIRTSDKINIHKTGENRMTRYALEISVLEQEDLVRSLNESDCISGPEVNLLKYTDAPIWKFKKEFKSETFYIKLYLDNTENISIEAISCHIDNI